VTVTHTNKLNILIMKKFYMTRRSRLQIMELASWKCKWCYKCKR